MKNLMQLPYIPPNVAFLDDAVQQGNTIWVADSTEAVLYETVMGCGWHDDASRYTTKKEKK